MNAKRDNDVSPKDTESNERSKAELSAYERWELPTLNCGEANDPPSNSYGVVSRREVKPLTVEDIEAIRQEAYQEGLKQGHAEGLALGVAEGREKGLIEGKQEGIELGRQQVDAELTGHKLKLEELAASLLKPIDEQKDQIEQVLLNTTLALTRAVIHTEVQQNPNVIQNALRSSIEQLPSHASGIKLTLNPQDHVLVSELITTIAPEAKVEANNAIVRGGCLVETSTQVLDHTIEKRFQKVVQSMLLQAAQASDFQAHQESPQTLECHTDYPAETLNEAVSATNPAGDQPNGDSTDD